MTETRLWKVSDTGRGRRADNPLCNLEDHEDEYKWLLVSIIGKMSEWGQKKKDTGKCPWSVMTSLDIGDLLELGKGHTKHNTRDTSNTNKRNSMATIIMGQLYNYETNKVKYPTGASVSWNQLQDFETINNELARFYPDEYYPIKIQKPIFDWNGR